MEEYKRNLILNWCLFFTYSCIIFYTVHYLAYSWPNTGSFIWFLLIFLCPSFLYQFSVIACTLSCKKPPTKKILLRLITLILGFFLAGGLLKYAQNSSLRKMSRTYEPLVAQIQKNMPTPCNGDYFNIAKIVKYNNTTHLMIAQEGQPIGELFHNKKRFILYFSGGSIDIDGSTLLYDSTLKYWQIFHNDNSEMLEKLEKEKQGLNKCETF